MTDYMRRVLSLLTPFALALVLAFGSVGFASAHQSGAGADKYVICTGYGLVTITVDEKGNRVADGVPCPDSIALSAACRWRARLSLSALAVAPAGFPWTARFTAPDAPMRMVRCPGAACPCSDARSDLNQRKNKDMT